MSLETDDPVDDIRIDLVGGRTAFVQAKRHLTLNSPLRMAAEQWRLAQRQGLDPDKHRLVIACGSLSEGARRLQGALDRLRTGRPSPPSGPEGDALNSLRRHLSTLDETAWHQILACAVIAVVPVEEPHLPSAREAIACLRVLRPDADAAAAAQAWTQLLGIAGHAARLRTGWSLQGWLERLPDARVLVDPSSATPAGEWMRTRAALDHYHAQLRRRGSVIDLSSLGAALAPLPLAEVDADVRVARAERDRKTALGDSLTWSLLRHGRVVLTGLPGGGKSHALRALAAQLTDAPGAPIPMLVSLPDVDTRNHTDSFRDRLLACAVSTAPRQDRLPLTDHLDKCLNDGGVVVLLDSLDELYERRASVIREIHDFVDTCHPDVTMLIATRSVAYGHAATLGWRDLQLLPPADLDRVVAVVLERAAHSPGLDLSESGAEQWVGERADWVSRVLLVNPSLRETPLFPLLLALIAVHREVDDLPRGRVNVIRAALQMALSKHEVPRLPGGPLGRLNQAEIPEAALGAFSVEASALLDAGGRATLDDLKKVVADYLRTTWDLTPGPASTTAERLVRLLDESGIFIMSSPQEVVTPRISLFAEAGDALRAPTDHRGLVDWAQRRITRGQSEPLALAAEVRPDAANAAAEAAISCGDANALRLIARTVAAGADLSDERRGQLCRALVADLARGTGDSWRSWSALQQLRLTPDLWEAAVAAADAHSPEHAVLVSAAFSLACHDPEEMIAKPAHLLAVLGVTGLRRPAREPSDPLSDLWFSGDDAGLHAVQEQAGSVLLGRVPQALALVVQRAQQMDSETRRRMVTLLRDRGFEREAELATEAPLSPTGSLWWESLTSQPHLDFLQLLAGLWDHSGLTWAQATRTTELADFLETLALNDGGSHHLLKRPDLKQIAELTAALFGFEGGVLSAQAGLVLKRVQHDGGSTDAYFMLFQDAQERRHPGWSAINDVPAALNSLDEMLRLTAAQARFAVQALQGVPSLEVVPVLRRALADLVSSEQHQRLVAMALARILGLKEMLSWGSSDNTVLRVLLADVSKPGAGGYLQPYLLKLLDDPDAAVRMAALRNAVTHRPPDLTAVLQRVAVQPPAGWTCTDCRTLNAAKEPRCRGPKCRRGKPGTASAVAREQLKDPSLPFPDIAVLHYVD